MRRLAFLGTCLLLSTGCAGGGAYRSAGEPGLRESREVIQLGQHPDMQELDAYQVVRRLRPFFLNTRGPTSVLLPSNQVTVFIDEMPIGGVGELTTIRARDISQIRFMSSTEAVIRYGRRFAGGIIKLVTR